MAEKNKRDLRPNRINKKYLFADFCGFNEIDENVRQKNKDNFFAGGFRINNSMFRTVNETDEYIRKSLKRRLP